MKRIETQLGDEVRVPTAAELEAFRATLPDALRQLDHDLPAEPLAHYCDPEGQPCTFTESLWYQAEPQRRFVARTDADDWAVSTVFLCLNHNWGAGPPLIYETMIFTSDKADPLDQTQQRYSTRIEALAGHREWVELLTTRAPDDASEA